jgi:hypothetical protein
MCRLSRCYFWHIRYERFDRRFIETMLDTSLKLHGSIHRRSKAPVVVRPPKRLDNIGANGRHIVADVRFGAKIGAHLKRLNTISVRDCRRPSRLCSFSCEMVGKSAQVACAARQACSKSSAPSDMHATPPIRRQGSRRRCGHTLDADQFATPQGERLPRSLGEQKIDQLFGQADAPVSPLSMINANVDRHPLGASSFPDFG